MKNKDSNRSNEDHTKKDNSESLISSFISSPSILETDEIDKRTYNQAKKRVDYLTERYKSRFAFNIAYAVSFGLLFGIWTFINLETSILPIYLSIIFSVVCGACFSVFLLFFVKALSEGKISKYKRIILTYEANNEIMNEVKEKVDEDIYENLIKISYTYLDQYYLLVREQAQKSFFITLGISIAGAVLIVIGIVSMFFGIVEPSYISAGAGVLTEFISAVFFYLYNRTVTSMSKYHNKLVLSQNISLAIKIVDSLPEEEQTRVKERIISELLKDINSFLISKDGN